MLNARSTHAPRLPVASPGAVALAGALALAALSGPAAAAAPVYTLLALIAAVLVAAIFVHPPVAAYTLLLATPLMAGLERGELIPLLRPSEAVAIVVIGALVLRGAAVSRGRFSPRIGRLDGAILLLTVAGSLIPVMWMLARGKELTQDDLLYALQLWKYYAVFVAVRAAIRTEKEVRVCLWLSMIAASVVGAIAVIEAGNLFGLPDLLSQYYGVEGADKRGSSTLGSPHAVADVMVMNLAIAAGWLIRGGSRRGPLLLLAAGFVFGIIASGEFSGYLGLLLAVGTVGLITGTLGRSFLFFVPVVTIAALSLRSVVATRLSGFESETGMPQSWEVRLENLRTFFWPQLTDNFNWIMGVRPAPRVPGPERWRDWVWIESGHTYLLWTGGVLFFLAFFVFLWTAMRRVARVARERSDAIGVAAIASLTGLVLVAVLMTFDPHLTFRGAADLNFSLLALALVGSKLSGGRSTAPQSSRAAPAPGSSRGIFGGRDGW